MLDVNSICCHIITLRARLENLQLYNLSKIALSADDKILLLLKPSQYVSLASHHMT